MFFIISNSLTNVLQILKHYSNNSSVNLRRVVLIRCAYADSCSRSQRSETQAICAAMDPSSEEEAGSQQDEPRSKAATSADSSRWPISVEHSKPSECCLCASRARTPTLWCRRSRKPQTRCSGGLGPSTESCLSTGCVFRRAKCACLVSTFFAC